MHRKTAFATVAAALVAAAVLGAAPAATAADSHPAEQQQINRGWDASNRGWSTQDGSASDD